MDVDAVVDRFNARWGEPIHLGYRVRQWCGWATVPRSFTTSWFRVDDEADRLAWLGATGFPCPRIVDRGNPQYGGPPAAHHFAETYGADPEDPRIAHYIDLDNSGAY
ncbi:hypothetical protein [Kribbella sp. VKM Ac-2568]|uniref:hypothetical protein n=1 Tax=Kribbella sp. VKM Ac-2568 TaxID=2512219 RepID=UPI0010E2A50C|nr:hypothetical protein [Kribbella sp. VKM Ac-2568]TCM46703.1 hypothetical protein EV648_105180 [Kribbella sp. VKM Ac-2568]